MGVPQVQPATDAVDIQPALTVIEDMAPVTATDIIPLLQKLQAAYGYLPHRVVLEVCERTGLPARQRPECGAPGKKSEPA